MLCAIGRMELDVIERPSPNFDERQLPVSMIVLHYTGMPDADQSLAWLTDHAEVAADHYHRFRHPFRSRHFRHRMRRVRLR